MSAICGILRFGQQDVRDSDLTRQINALSRRGPDGLKTWCRGPIGFGHALMRVTDEDAFDAQPLNDDATGLALVADLRLDNREELAAALDIDAEALRTMPDSALLLRAYEKWGEDCAERLIGDFAFAIWDGRKSKLVLGRDHIGQRHVFFHSAPGFFAFASEKKGLWALEGVPQTIDEIQMGRFLIGDSRPLDGATWCEGVFGLPGGTILSVGADGSIARRRYWEPHAAAEHIGRDEAYYIEAYRRVLTEAVACRLRRNTRPTALFLSGGFDSAAIAGLAGPVLAPRNRKLIAVSSVMPQDYNGPLPHARKWVEMCQRHMPHLDVRYVTREKYTLFGRLEEDFLKNDNGISPNRVAKAALYSEVVAGGARVVMDGHGGDYTLNPKANGWLADRLKTGDLGTFFRELRWTLRTRNRPFWLVLRTQIFMPLLPEAWRRSIDLLRRGRRPSEPNRPIAEGLAARTRADGAQRRVHIPKSAPAGRWAMKWAALSIQQEYPDAAGYVGGARYGLEHTLPFHDKRVIELALAIPPSLYVRSGLNRYLARQALKDVYPPEFQTRPSGYDDPLPDFDEMLAREIPFALTEIARMERNPQLRRFFDFAKMRKMLTHKPPLNDGYNPEPRLAANSFIWARFVEWTLRDNTRADVEVSS